MTEELSRLHDIEIGSFLKQCVDLVPEAITEEFSRLSGDYAYWNEKYTSLNRQLLLAEWDEEKIWSRLYILVKEGSGEGKKPTEAQVEATVKLNPEYEQVHLRVIGLQAERDHLRGVLEALRTKREMLVSVGAHMRQEMEGDARIMERATLKKFEREG